ncbi:hypothetical protein PRZ48_001906 [Zasmidium cellare]|uniref:Uncharacterized protein n=1 Tax=Zasmidium cellare TaxID=395010 RepID=A0ABR0F4F0_ZASCE|nr:hypothetical protein PRZ48_001906 [Zasmidium cellare]
MAKGDAYMLRKSTTFGSEGGYYPSDHSTSGSSRRNSPNYKQPKVIVHKPSGPNTDDEPSTRDTPYGGVYK